MSSPVAATPLELAARELAPALQQRGVVPLVIGSFALVRIAPQLLDHTPRDLDLLLPDDLSTLEGAHETLVHLGYLVTSWEEALTLPLDRAQLSGRYYLRARREAVIVDLTYECPRLDYHEALRRAVSLPPWQLAALDDLLTLYAGRDEPRDRALLARAGR